MNTRKLSLLTCIEGNGSVRWGRMISMFICLVMVLNMVACAAPPTAAPQAETGQGDSAAPDAAGGWTRQYAGTMINFIGEATLNTQILEKLIPEFTEKTGIEVKVEQAPYDNLVQKAVLDFSTHKGSYDILSVPYEYLGSFAEQGYIRPLDQELTGPDAAVMDFDPTDLLPTLWDESAKWKDHVYGMPSNSAVMMMFYRKDLFENPQEKEAFEKQYGYPLAPAQTWEQFRDIAEFFTRKSGSTLASQPVEQDFYGVSLAGKRHIATVLEWFNYAWTYGGGLFDESGNLQANLDANVQSLQYWIDLTAYAPPGYTSATWDEVTAALQQGTAAQAITWADTAGSMEDPEQSKVKGNMGYASIPTLKEGDKRVAHLGSWFYTINKDSKNQDAALLFMKWALSKSTQLAIAKAGGLPATKSAFTDSDLSAQLPYWKQTMVSLEEARIRPRIPQWGAISDIMSLELSRVMAKEASPKDALDEAQNKLNDALKDALPVTYE